MPSHHSPIWKMPKDQLQSLVDQSETFTEILAVFGLKLHGGNNATLRNRLDQEGIDYSGLIKRRKGKTKPLHKNSIPLKEVLIKGSSYSRGRLKRRIIEAGLLDQACASCGQDATWNGKPLVLVLDHINGINNDNRIENLRLLCPNCNSQTGTFAGRQLRSQTRQSQNCQFCGRISPKGLCRKCSGKDRRKPLVGMSDDELAKMVWERPVSQIAKDLGVSDVALSKRCRVRNIPVPPRGYWAKSKSFGV